MTQNKSAQTSLLDSLDQKNSVPKATPPQETQKQSSKQQRKSPGAFRTISEVADELGVQQHVLRFWESKFSQVKPLKRGGGRRYYRPEDVELLRRIHSLLYTDGYTIKGVQKLLANAKGPLSAIERTREKGETVETSTTPQTPQKREELSGLLKDLKDTRKMLEERDNA